VIDHGANSTSARKQSKLAAVRAAFVVLMLVVAPRIATAGKSNYGWLYGDEVLPKRGTEVQTWVYERNGIEDDTVRETHMWWGALVGVTDKFELVFPTEWIWRIEDGEDGALFTLEKFGVEARYRFTKLDAENPDGVSPLLRLAVKRDVTQRDITIAEFDYVMGYRKGRFHGQIDLGATGRFNRDEAQLELRPGAGIAIEIKEDLRLGAEAYGEIFLDEAVKNRSWFGVGPNIAWVNGRFWLSASMLIGVHQIDTAPRLIWGILF
jgi:hypothetical protein